jgi:hypothetical protein
MSMPTAYRPSSAANLAEVETRENMAYAIEAQAEAYLCGSVGLIERSQAGFGNLLRYPT